MSGFCQVTGNLIEALSRLRHAFKDRVLWIDALCINQDGEGAEKPCQVLLMSEIYSCASQVLIWLGETPSRPVVFGRPDVTAAAFDYIAWVNQLDSSMRDLDLFLSVRSRDFDVMR
jgi:hypothetical protein